MFGSGEKQAEEKLREALEELRSTQEKLRAALEELRSFKQRMGEGLTVSLKAGHTENMNNPVNKSRIQEMYHYLRVNELPEVTNQLADKGEDPQMFQELIQGTFQEAVSTTSRLLEYMNQTLRGKRSKKEHPHKVQEYINSSMQSLQMAFFHCNKKDLHRAAVRKATVVSTELVSECYWLGCLMALNNPPIQPDWNNHRPGMDPWNILPREITHITQELISERRMHNPDDGLAQSSVSVNSGRSIERPIYFRNPSIHNSIRSSTVEQQRKTEKTQQSSNYTNATLQLVEDDILKSVKERMQRFDRLLTSDHPQSTSEPPGTTSGSEQEAVLNIILDFLRRIDEPLANILQKETAVAVCCHNLKSHLLKKFSQVCEGVAKAGSSTSLQQIYTELYITEGGASEVSNEHEVGHIETSRRPAERIIACEDIFKQHLESEQPIRTMLTVGVAGVGKTVLTQKVSLDWAEGKSNQDVQLLFPFTFRALNLLKDKSFSLVELLHHFFSQTKGLCSFQQLHLLFIFDGLDECRLPLDFTQTKALTEHTESASVEELLVNLIRGNLLPSARLWITTRPAAANQIPVECVSMVTEVRGFSDPQREQYFRKRFLKKQAEAAMSFIKSIRSLYIMCRIPVFSWILSTVLENMMKSKITEQLPKTLTEMYIHFLVVQAKVKNIKYHEGTGADLHWTEETREMVRSLGKLAFEQLLKGNLIFYESDLKECGLDAAEIARYSGVFTQVFREEPGLYEDKVYCFIHLTVQEFLAALHVHQTFFSSGKNLLSTPHSFQNPEAFYCSAVDRAIQSPNGNLDLFLRFLLGLSLPTNQSLLKGLMTQTGHDSTNQETVKYIKKKLNEKGLSAERSLNLLHCLNELNDHSMEEEIQKVMKGGGVFDKHMSSAHWSALAFLLLSSDSNLEDFDLNKYYPSDEALQKLLPVVKASKKATLSCCNLSQRSCGPLASALSSSSLTYLDLSNNDLWDSGVELLCERLKSGPKRLETLRLSGCLVSEDGTASLVTALSSASFHLKELDLSYNHPGPSSKRLAALLAQPHRLIDSLTLKPAGKKWLIPGLNKYYCKLSLEPNTANGRLKLSDNNHTVTFMEEDQLYPNHQDRFDSCPQVLCSTALNGRYYWEVGYAFRENGSVCVALSYISITSKDDGKNREFGANKESWALKINREGFSVSHDGTESKPPYTPHQTYDSSYHNRVAVYLDYTGGSLSFYEISEGRKTLLYTYHASFTQPLFAGFTVHRGSVSLV